MRPVDGWEKIIFEGVTAIASTIRKIHMWMDESGITRTALLCDGHLYMLDGNQLTDISPVPPITGPAEDPLVGGYGDDKYSLEEYGDARPDQFRETLVGSAFSLDNCGEDLLAMVSSDGRLLRWSPRDAPGSVGDRGAGRPDRLPRLRGHARAPRHAVPARRQVQHVRLVPSGGPRELGLR